MSILSFDRVTLSLRASGSGVTASTTLLTTLLVPLTTLCPTFLAVSAVSSATSFAFSTGPSAQTSPRDRATAMIVERESFIVLKISYSACQLAAPVNDLSADDRHLAAPICHVERSRDISKHFPERLEIPRLRSERKKRLSISVNNLAADDGHFAARF